MHALMLCIATAAVGIDTGWQQMPEGGMEYIIQLQPQDLEALRDGQPLCSDIPPAAGNVRSYRMVVDSKPLPRDEAAPAVPEIPPKAAESDGTGRDESPPKPPHELLPDPGGKPLAGRAAVFLEQQDAAVTTQPQPETTQDELSEETPRPWLPLTLTLFGLFTSLGVNVFLGWVAWDFHHRYRAEHAVI